MNCKGETQDRRVTRLITKMALITTVSCDVLDGLGKIFGDSDEMGSAMNILSLEIINNMAEISSRLNREPHMTDDLYAQYNSELDTLVRRSLSVGDDVNTSHN